MALHITDATLSTAGQYSCISILLSVHSFAYPHLPCSFSQPPLNGPCTSRHVTCTAAWTSAARYRRAQGVGTTTRWHERITGGCPSSICLLQFTEVMTTFKGLLCTPDYGICQLAMQSVALPVHLLGLSKENPEALGSGNNLVRGAPVENMLSQRVLHDLSCLKACHAVVNFSYLHPLLPDAFTLLVHTCSGASHTCRGRAPLLPRPLRT
jgi:hypothetical protein